MDELNVSSVNAESTEVVAPVTEQAETTESVNGEVAAPQEETKPVQTKEENARFAEMRRRTEQETRDKTIAELSDGQYATWAQYQQAMQEHQRRQEAEQKGLDPEFYNEFQSVKDELNSYKREKTLLQQETQLANDPVKGELFSQWEDDVKQMANDYNVDLRTAFTLVLEERLGDILGKTKEKAQQETIKKITDNASSTPGALSSEQVPPVNFSKMSREEFQAYKEKVKRGEIR